MNNKRKKIKNPANLHRKYHRISTFTPDQQAFVNYLMQRGYDLTLKAFQQEIQDHFKYSYDYFQNLIQKGENVSYENFQSWVLEVKKYFTGKPNQFIKLQFMLLVWFFSFNSNKISEENSKILRNFIQINGIKLSQFPQLLPYFALPYCHQPSNHPFLSKIYTKQWKQQVKFLFKQYCSNQKQIIPKNLIINQQIQWYSVVKDLLEICLVFDQQCSNKNNKHMQMLQRVNKYKKVIEDNEGSLAFEGQSIRPQQLSRLVFYPQNKFNKLDQTIKSVSSVDEKVFYPIDYASLKNTIVKLKIDIPRDHKQLCLIYYALNERIINSQTIKAKVKLIYQYTQNDIFFLKDSTTQQNQRKIQQIQCLKLISTMCGQKKFVSLLSQSLKFIQILTKIISQHQKVVKNEKYQQNKSNNLGSEQRLLEVLSILQKISFKKQTVQKIIRLDLIPVLIKKYMAFYQVISINILTYVLAIILNIILQKQGKRICSSIKCHGSFKASNQRFNSFFQQMIKIWKHFYKNKGRDQKQQFNEVQSQLQSIIYSIFYVLLSVDSNRKIAKSVNFQQILETFLKQNNDEYHQKVVEYMLEIIRNGAQKDIQPSDRQEQDVQNDDFDLDCVNNNEIKNYVWVGDVLTQLQPSLTQNIESILQKFYNCQKKTSEKIKDPKQIQQNILKNVSEPLKIIKIDQQQKDLQIKQKNIVNNSQTFNKLQNYDPNKYRSWKRIKASKQ